MLFTKVQTDRLIIRPFTLEDAVGLAARRNEAEVSEHQNWIVPYPLEEAERITRELVAMDGPADEEWWMAIVCDASTGETLGDLALHLTSKARTAEIGYSFSRQHWGNGYAVEATAALIEFLFETVGVTRVFGMLHPDNVASAMVLERCGLLFEGHTRSSFWLGDEVSDDWIYGMTRPDWEAWVNRPTTAPESVELIEISAANVRQVSKLLAHKTQEDFVAPMSASFTHALFPEVVNGAPVVPWMRAIVADGEFVGFTMLALRTENHPEPYLWRLLIDRMHQRRGIGHRALALLESEVAAIGDRTLLTSWSEGKGSPRGFYIENGFVPTGQIVDGETEARKMLD
ncbi:MAG: GNAT family N-acetyltransferase [Acidimicrobiia bacterium]|nr:GNAT family N-acetyltransferase [Acidimicrobiia bacterium]